MQNFKLRYKIPRKSISKILFIMKISMILLMLVFLQAGATEAYSQKARVTIHAKNAKLSDVLDEMERQTDYLFFYNKKNINANKRVTVNAKDVPVSDVLDKTLDSDVAYGMVNDHVILSKKENLKENIAVAAILQQTIVVTGTVTDTDGEPVIGANVVEKGTTNGNITDVNGKFTLNVSPGATLVISFIGYHPQEVVVSSRTVLQITLQEDTKVLEEVVVIGYGTRSKRDVTTAISNISSETIEKNIAMSPELSMQGTMTGVQVSGNTGDPMSRPTIRIRGTNTWGVSDPLYVIDGIAITEMGAGIEGQEDARIADVRGPMNIMSMIDPTDIESISVLKDASAAAIYGVRAANGVILITTKKGKKDKPTVDFSARYGIQNITQELDWLTTPEYTKFVQGVFASDPEKTPSSDNTGRFDPSSPRYLGNSPTYNWQDAVRNKNAGVQDYSIKISGGTDNTDYYVSLGYSRTEGTLLVNSMDRYSGAVKVNTKINEYLKAGINYRIVSAKGVHFFQGDNYFDVIRSAPWQPIYQADGIPGYNGYAYGVGGLLPDGSYSNEKLYGQGTRINVIGMVNTNDNRNESLRNLGNVYLELTPFKGLSIKGTLSIDRYLTNWYTFTDYLTNPFSYTGGDPREKGGGKSVGGYVERDVLNHNFMQEFMVNYANTFNRHSIDFLFNFSNQQYGAKYKGEETEYMTTLKDYLRNLGGENQYTSVGSDQRRWALQGYLLRAGYNYAYKYYLDATVRRDGSARFAPENRWGTFPSVSAAWRIKNEEFMSSLTWLDDLKLRGGWGQLGNQEVRDMAYLSVISTAPTYAFGNVSSGSKPATGNFNPGATTFGMANTDLTWERTKIANFGFDAQLFRNLTFSAEYYHKTTDGILQVIDLPTSVGVTENPVANVAKVRNEGFEFSANYNGTVNKFYYSIGGNLTTVKNRVLGTYRDVWISHDAGMIEEGHSMFYHRAYKVGGIFQTDAEAQAWMEKIDDSNYTKSKVGAGDFYFQDLRGAPKNEGELYSEGPDGKIDAYDMVDIGNSIPGFFYGLNLSAGYSGFDFSVQFTGVGDVIKNNGIKSGNFRPTEGDNVTRIVYNAWTPENKQNEYPRLNFSDPAQNMRSSDFFYESAAYFRLQNIQLGYTLPKKVYVAGNNAIRNVRIYAGSSNLFLITPYTGLDPESDAYPVPRTFYLGLTAKF
jgi:TonB-linked SusC/RagA family outer membrane protein